MRYRHCSAIVEAVRWWRYGDGPTTLEGPAVRPFRDPAVSDAEACGLCGALYTAHGRMSTLAWSAVVCPGDWIVSGGDLGTFPVSDRRFRAVYVPVEPEGR